MPPKRKCDCGECSLCKQREYKRRWAAARGGYREPGRPLGDDPVICRICGMSMRSLQGHPQTHRLTMKEYRARFPDAQTVAESLREIHRELWIDMGGWDGRGLKWTRERCIAAFRSEWKRRGRQPTATDFRRSRNKRVPRLGTVEGFFGTWNAFVEAAGGTPLPNTGRPGAGVLERCQKKGHLRRVLPSGVRYCPTCKTERDRERYAARKAVG